MIADLATLHAVESELDTRWGETKLEPSLDRITALVDLLAEPHRAYPVLHVAGTNGKTSTTRLIDALLTRIGLRTGRFTSPHLQSVLEQIAIDNRPIDSARYVETYRDVRPYVSMADDVSDVRLSRFEIVTAMAFAAFAETPVDVAVIEAGMGGAWDATNIVDAQVAVLTPIGVDHTTHLGSDLVTIAENKAGIIKANSIAVLAAQAPEVQRALIRRAVEVDSVVARQDMEFGIIQRTVAVGGQMLTLQGLGGLYTDIFLPLHGEHQARNASLALAAVEAFFGAGVDRQLDQVAVREAFASAVVPGRLERLRSSPTVFVDAAHNPHGAAALAAALESEFGFRRLVGVVGVLEDKDVTGILAALEPVLNEIVVTRNSSPRALPADELGAVAREVFGDDRVLVEPRLDDAIESAVRLAEEVRQGDGSISGGGVVATGSVVTAGEVRTLFGKEPV